MLSDTVFVWLSFWWCTLVWGAMSDGKEGRLKSAFRGVTTILPHATSVPDTPYYLFFVTIFWLLRSSECWNEILHTGQKHTRIRPAPPPPPWKTSKRCRFFWSPKRVIFGINLALKCPIFVTFLTSREIDQKRTLLLKEFLVIFTFRIVFTRHSVAPDWQKVLFFKITIVLTASCQNHYRFDDLWSFMLSDNISVRLNF